MGVLTLLLAAPALMCLHAACAADPDIWWHMRVGQWILQHHAIPHTEIFSRDLAGTPWLAYSWIFELLTFKLFQWFGVVGIVTYSAGMILAITVALRHMIQRLQTDFSVAFLLTFATCFSFSHLYTPRPWMFSILLFILELDILMHARKTGRTRELAWLPFIFALWANVHIEFIYGLLVLGLAWFESVAARWWSAATTRIQPVWMSCALLASALATLANPFSWRIYGVVYDLATEGGGLDRVSEVHAIPFRDLADYCILVLALASVGALVWSRRLRLFESGLLLFAVVRSFHSQRDVWILSVAGAAILASTPFGGRNRPVIRLPKYGAALAAMVAAFAVLTGFRAMHVNKALLNTQIANILPVHAVEAIQAKGYAGPIYNDFNWGGYLIWSLRRPVSIDGRTNVYGDQRIERSIATWNAQKDWSSDAQLTSARVVIGPVSAPLIQLLRLDPKYKLVYEDKMAVVFIAQK
jgi:hypothetical protein